MREELGEILGVRGTFTAEFDRLGNKKCYRGPDNTTVLLRDVRTAADGHLVADHVWFNLTSGFAAIQPLQSGERLQFDARVKAYSKGYQGYRRDSDLPLPAIDYKLARPTRIQRVSTWQSRDPTVEEVQYQQLRQKRRELQFDLNGAERDLQSVRCRLADRVARGVPAGSKKYMRLHDREPMLVARIAELREQIDALGDE